MKIFEALARFSLARASAVRARVGGTRKPQRPRGRQLSVPLAARTQGQQAREPGDHLNAKSFPVDPSLPQLEIIGDPELMREVFQRHLRPLDGENYQVRECLISHTRYRMATRCVLQYTLRLANPETGRERSQWVTGVMYAGDRTRRIWEELRRSDLGRAVPGASPTFAPFSYIPDLDMLVQVFPYDRRLPALPLLMEGPPPELEPLLLARFGLGDWRAEAWNVEPVRYLTEKRATLRLTARAQDAATGRAEEKRFYAKVYHDEEGEQTHQVLRALWEKADVGEAGFTVARPIAYLSDLRTLVQEEVSGTSLQDMLRRGDDVTSVVRKVARALATLHLNNDVVAPRHHRLRDNVARLERAGKFLQRTCPHLRTEIEEAVGGVVAGLEEAPLAPTHGDLRPDHIMLDGDRLILIDLDDFAWGDPILDVGRLSAVLAKVHLRSPLHHDHPRAVAQTFVEEYFAHVPEAWRTRLPLHYAGAYLRLAFGLLRHQSPGWPDKVEAMVEEARDSLAGKVW